MLYPGVNKRRPAVEPIAPDELVPDPRELVHRDGVPSTIDEWKARAGMAAFASHHVRLALFPFRLDTDRTGYVDIPHSLSRQRRHLLEDVNTIRETNNAIFDRCCRRKPGRGSPAPTTAGAGS